MTVYLVGAGPGDPGLMTARSLELIASADVIIYDRLIPVTALDGARADAKLIYAGKEGGGEQVPQAEITRLLVEHGRSAETVVRLKGGDPFVFGRGGEEAEALLDAGIAFEVVPGVSSGVAAPAYAGIPVTHRDASSAVAFVTGHEDPDKDETAIDWDALARFPGTLVFYMGVRRLEPIAARLIEGGRPPDEPAALVQSGTLPGQRSVQETLRRSRSSAVDQQIKAPAIAIFGPVAALHDKHGWLQRRPLHGVTIAVMRAREQASRLAERLRGLGADVVVAPVIRVQTLPGPAPELGSYDLICFTSPNGVDALFERLAAEGLDARAFPPRTEARVAAIGPATARALSKRGIVTDVMPESGGRRGAGGGARQRAGDTSAGRACTGGSRRGARGPPRARGRGRCRARVRNRRRGAQRRADCGRRGRRLHHLHLGIDRCATSWLPSAAQRHGWHAASHGRERSVSGRSRATSCDCMAWSRTSRLCSTTSTVSSLRLSARDRASPGHHAAD